MSLRYRLLIIVFLLTANISCKKQVAIQHPTQYSNFSEILNDFLDKLRKRYMFWDLEDTNIQRIRYHYTPLFAELSLQNPDDIKKSFDYFHEISRNFIDNHFQMTFLISPIRGRVINPSLERKSANIHIQFPYTEAASSYLDPGYSISYSNTVPASDVRINLLTGLINKSIIYFRFNTFNIQRAANVSEDIKKSFQQFVSYLESTEHKASSLIIDIRQNKGGDVSDLAFLISYLTNKDVKIGYFKTKSGANPLDYSEWIDVIILHQNFNAPNINNIVVLTDRNTASSAESLIFAIKSLPNSISIGETTRGATGLVADPTLFNTGSFELPGYMTVQMSSVAFEYLDRNSYENKGIEPNYVIASDSSSLKLGKDFQLEAAIQYISNRHQNK